MGGKQLVKMKDLKEFFEEVNCSDVQTLLQSGNVIFASSESDSMALEQNFETAFESQFGFFSDFILRDVDEIRDIIRDNPFAEMAETDPSHLVVIFFSEPVDPATVDLVNEKIVGREKIVPGSNYLYVSYPDGIGTSKVNRTPGWKELTSSGTARNWNTILKVAAMFC